jgi:hypothetical protein
MQKTMAAYFEAFLQEISITRQMLLLKIRFAGVDVKRAAHSPIQKRGCDVSDMPCKVVVPGEANGYFVRMHVVKTQRI